MCILLWLIPVCQTCVNKVMLVLDLYIAVFSACYSKKYYDLRVTLLALWQVHKHIESLCVSSECDVSVTLMQLIHLSGRCFTCRISFIFTDTKIVQEHEQKHEKITRLEAIWPLSHQLATLFIVRDSFVIKCEDFYEALKDGGEKARQVFMKRHFQSIWGFPWSHKRIIECYVIFISWKVQMISTFQSLGKLDKAMEIQFSIIAV